MANPHLIIFSFFLNFKEATRKIIYPKQLIPSFLSDLRRLKKKKRGFLWTEHVLSNIL